jgi:hypothetical protein
MHFASAIIHRNVLISKVSEIDIRCLQCDHFRLDIDNANGQQCGPIFVPGSFHVTERPQPAVIVRFPDRIRQPAGDCTGSEVRFGHRFRITLAAWAVIALLSVGRAALIRFPRHCGCYQIYAQAGRDWAGGADLYTSEPGLAVFRYSPLIAALLTPIGFMPDMLGSAVLRALTLAAFLAAVWRWSAVAAPSKLTFRQRLIYLLLLAPLAARSLIDVQFNGLLAALLVLGIVSLAQRRTGWAAVWWSAACLIKAYAIALPLVAILLYRRRFVVPFAIAAAVGLLLPFAFQSPTYVARQYDLWLRWGLNGRDSSEFQDIRFVLANLGVHWTFLEYRLAELLSAAGVALVCYRSWAAESADSLTDDRKLLSLTLGLSAAWMLLFGPATEDCTYILFAPTMAWVVLESALLPAARWLRAAVYGGYSLFVVGQIVYWFPWGGDFNRLGTFPIAAMILAAALTAMRSSSAQQRPADLPADADAIRRRAA